VVQTQSPRRVVLFVRYGHVLVVEAMQMKGTSEVRCDGGLQTHSETVVEMRRRWSGLTQPAEGSIGVLRAGGRGSEAGEVFWRVDSWIRGSEMGVIFKRMTVVS